MEVIYLCEKLVQLSFVWGLDILLVQRTQKINTGTFRIHVYFREDNITNYSSKKKNLAFGRALAFQNAFHIYEYNGPMEGEALSKLAKCMPR